MCAAALEAAAREVRAMFQRGSSLARLEWLAGTEDADACAYWLEEAYRISRHGFDRVEATSTSQLIRRRFDSVEPVPADNAVGLLQPIGVGVGIFCPGEPLKAS